MSDTNISQQPLAVDPKVCSNSTCPKAGQLQPLRQFHRAARCKGGHRPECKTCHNKYRADWARPRYVPSSRPRPRLSPERKLEIETLRSTRGAKKAARIELEARGLKACGKCREAKPLSEFYRRASGRGGRASICRDCKRAIKPAPNPRVSPERKLEIETLRAVRAARIALQARGLKACKKCGEAKSLAEFNRKAGGRGGRDAACRDCNRQACRDYRLKKTRLTTAEESSLPTSLP